MPRLALAFLAGLLLLPCPATADEAWKPVKTTRDGIAISRRPGRTSGFHEVRFQARHPAAPQRLADFVWDGFSQAHPPVQQRDFVVRQPGEIVFHDRVHAPVVSDREYTMRIVRERDGDVLRLVFRTAPELGPPPTPGLVTLPIAQGQWEFRPDATGTAVTYTVYSEPGGGVPAFLVRGTQVDEALDDFRRTLDEARRAPL